MSDVTKIEWTTTTWNPIRGCSKVSAGCANCYAEKVAARFSWGPDDERRLRDRLAMAVAAEVDDG